MCQTGDIVKENKQSWFCWVNAFIPRSGSSWVTWQSELREWQRTGSLRRRSVRLGCDTERHPAPHLAVLDGFFSANYGCLSKPINAYRISLPNMVDWNTAYIADYVMRDSHQIFIENLTQIYLHSSFHSTHWDYFTLYKRLYLYAICYSPYPVLPMRWCFTHNSNHSYFSSFWKPRRLFSSLKICALGLFLSLTF